MKSITLLLLLSLLSFSRVFADGAYKHLFLAELARIPRQSAAISFAEGKETLTIWNTVEAKGQDLAWVLPLPARPEVIRPSHPNAFKLLPLLTAPKVEVGKGAGGLGSGLLLLLGLSLMLIKRPRRRWLVPSAILLLVLLAAILIPVTSGTFGGGGPVVGVEVLSTQDAGNYVTTVISGTSGEAVNEWLRGAGFPVFTGGEARVLDAYVAKQWVFLCSRLKTTASGPSAGHPLSVRFPVEKPVYPMSLTKSAGTVPLEIFWMGEPVRDPSGRLDVKGATSDESFGAFRTLHRKFSALSAARAAHGLVGFESLQDRDLLLDQLLLASGVIRFTATFTPESDWSDFQFDPTREMPKLARHVTRQWLVDEAMNEVAFKVTAAFLLLGLASQWCGKPGRRPHIAWAGVGLVMILGAAGWAWSRLPKDVVIVENSQVRQPGSDGPDSPEVWFNDWARSLKEPKVPQ